MFSVTRPRALCRGLAAASSPSGAAVVPFQIRAPARKVAAPSSPLRSSSSLPLWSPSLLLLRTSSPFLRPSRLSPSFLWSASPSSSLQLLSSSLPMAAAATDPGQNPFAAAGALRYPPARRDPSVVDMYPGGAEIADPYRWLEDPDSEETKAFVVAQNKLTSAVLSVCEAERERLRERLTELQNYPRLGCPFKSGENVFFFHNSGLQPQYVLYKQSAQNKGGPVPADAARGETEEGNGGLKDAEVVLDVGALSDDGSVSLANYAFSEDGRWLAYGLSSGGSERQTVRVMRVEDRQPCAGEDGEGLRRVKHSCLEWTHNGKGFFYNTYDDEEGGKDTEEKDSSSPGNKEGQEETEGKEESGSSVQAVGKARDKNQRLWYHTIATPQSHDVLCWEDPANPDWTFGAQVTDDGEYLLVTVFDSCEPVNQVYFTRLDTLPPDALSARPPPSSPPSPSSSPQPPPLPPRSLLPLKKLVATFDAQYSYVANDGDVFTFVTNHNAPRSKVVRVRLRETPEAEEWEEVVPQHDTAVLEWVRCVNRDFLVCCYLRDVSSVLEVRRLNDGSLVSELPLPGIGSVGSSSGRRQDTQLFFTFSSFLTPSTIFSCDLSKQPLTLQVFRETVVKGFDPTLFETKQVFVPSSVDGTRIPMFITGRKDMKLDGSNPALLYGYGGFSISITPSFSVAKVVLMQHLGVVTAVANIRGGGEYGEEWHKAGSLERKTNCFDDFVSCAEYLVREGYTQPTRLCIEGHSNGGLLVGACVNRRPDLFGCALAHVGVMDMLRFHHFGVGHAWASDFGCADKNEEQFGWLIGYSPLHNIRRPWERETDTQTASAEAAVGRVDAAAEADFEQQLVAAAALLSLKDGGDSTNSEGSNGSMCSSNAAIESSNAATDSSKAATGGSSSSSSSSGFQQYPCVMLLTGDHDDLVLPLHSLKLIATLQHTLVHSAGGSSASPQQRPLVVRVDVRTGHGRGASTQKVIEEAADSYAFMAKAVGAQWRN